jgi:enoyl-CoA hydratase
VVSFFVMSEAIRAETVLVEKDGPVTTITLNRPFVRNAVDNATAERLVEAFRAFDADATASVAVFTGAAGAFCAGGDLKEVAATNATGWRELGFPADGSAAPRGPMGPSRMELSKPVIAAVAGPATAGGTELALWCDIRVLEQSAYFGIYCRRWGVPLIDGGTVRLPRLVGLGRAMEIILTGRKVPAAEALAIGLCEKVVPDGEGLRAAQEMAREIGRFPQECVRADFRSIRAQHGLPLQEALRQEWSNGVDTLVEGVAGAARFAGGAGRGGDFTEI